MCFPRNNMKVYKLNPDGVCELVEDAQFEQTTIPDADGNPVQCQRITLPAEEQPVE